MRYDVVIWKDVAFSRADIQVWVEAKDPLEAVCAVMSRFGVRFADYVLVQRAGSAPGVYDAELFQVELSDVSASSSSLSSIVSYDYTL